jgi:hypothetical protein
LLIRVTVFAPGYAEALMSAANLGHDQIVDVMTPITLSAGSATNRRSGQYSRRGVLALGLVSGAAWLSGCGGTAESVATQELRADSSTTPSENLPSQPLSGPPPVLWDVGTLSFVAGTDSLADLASTLPATVPSGGTFGLAENSAPLPAGMTLSPTGILRLGSAGAGQLTGVIFTYSSPSA